MGFTTWQIWKGILVAAGLAWLLVTAFLLGATLSSFILAAAFLVGVPSALLAAAFASPFVFLVVRAGGTGYHHAALLGLAAGAAIGIVLALVPWEYDEPSATIASSPALWAATIGGLGAFCGVFARWMMGPPDKP